MKSKDDDLVSLQVPTISSEAKRSGTSQKEVLYNDVEIDTDMDGEKWVQKLSSLLELTSR